MKIGVLIGGLGQGGAERQLVELARGLVRRGHTVRVLAYTVNGPAEAAAREQGVPVEALGAGSKWEKFRSVRRWLRTFRPEVIHGVMKRASSLAVLANLPARRCRVVGTDMSTASYARHKPDLWAALLLYAFTDAVVTQTEMNRRNLARLAPWLARRIQVIRNGVDTERFRPAEGGRTAGPFRFVCVGTVYRVKNPVRVVEAAALLAQREAGDFCLEWYGRPGLSADGLPSEEFQRAQALVRSLGLEKRVRFMGPRHDIETVYRQADTLVHASLQEGTPNAVVEAMASGLPVVVSRVSDLPLIVETARNGFVCDATDPAAIADAMERLLRTPPAERVAMGRRSRELAERWFGPERFVAEFEALYASLLGRP